MKEEKMLCEKAYQPYWIVIQEINCLIKKKTFLETTGNIDFC